MARSDDGAIAERSLKQLGLLTYQDLYQLGVSRAARRDLLAVGVLVAVLPRIVRHAAHPVTWEQTLLALVMHGGEHAVVSHLAAAALWRFSGISLGAVEITVPYGAGCRTTLGKVHRTRLLDDIDTVRDRLLPATSPTRTLLDISPRLQPDQLQSILDDGERRGLLQRSVVVGRLEALRTTGRAGLHKLARLLDDDDRRRVDSWLERRALRVIRAGGLPPPSTQVQIRTDRGAVARVDLTWLDRRLIVELDGHGSHATRRERQADAQREAQLVLDRWRVLRFTFEDVVERPSYVVATIAAALCAEVAAQPPELHTDRSN